MKTKPFVGQQLYMLPSGIRVRRMERKCNSVNPTQVIVTSVGSKYFKVKEPRQHAIEITFHIDNWRQKTEYSADYILYESEFAYTEERDSERICRRIYEDFMHARNMRNLTIDKLRKIEAILDAGNS
jgi:hypothetical protein